MINLTPVAVGKVREILDAQEPKPSGLRIAVVGGGCSGFSYSMAFENAPGMLDKTYDFDGLKVFIDQASMLYLDGAEVDYVESLEGAGFKFNNPHVKSTCGCGSSFSAATSLKLSQVNTPTLKGFRKSPRSFSAARSGNEGFLVCRPELDLAGAVAPGI